MPKFPSIFDMHIYWLYVWPIAFAYIYCLHTVQVRMQENGGIWVGLAIQKNKISWFLQIANWVVTSTHTLDIAIDLGYMIYIRMAQKFGEKKKNTYMKRWNEVTTQPTYMALFLTYTQGCLWIHRRIHCLDIYKPMALKCSPCCQFCTLVKVHKHVIRWAMSFSSMAFLNRCYDHDVWYSKRTHNYTCSMHIYT